MENGNKLKQRHGDVSALIFLFVYASTNLTTGTPSSRVRIVAMKYYKGLYGDVSVVS